MHILEAIRNRICLQTVLFISPYWTSGRRVTTPIWVTVYTICGALCFTYFVHYSAQKARAEQSSEFRARIGYLWGAIAMFEFGFTNFAYPALVLHQLINRRHEIAFLEGVARMDEELERVLGVRMDAFNRRSHRRLLRFMGLTFVYFNCLWAALVFMLAINHIELGIGSLMFLCANQLEQFSMTLLTWAVVSDIRIMRTRFVALRRVRLHSMVVPSKGSYNVVVADARMRERCALWLDIFKRLAAMVDSLSVNMGNVLVVRFAHDFTLLLSQLYMVYTLMMDYKWEHLGIVVFVAFWAIQNVLKITYATFFAHRTVEEAYLTASAILAQNVDGMDVVVSQMLDSFALWLLHRKIRFTANNFFTVDLTLVYAVVGALASYLLILIQFKQQEESISAANSALTALAATTAVPLAGAA